VLRIELPSPWYISGFAHECIYYIIILGTSGRAIARQARDSGSIPGPAARFLTVFSPEMLTIYIYIYVSVRPPLFCVPFLCRHTKSCGQLLHYTVLSIPGYVTTIGEPIGKSTLMSTCANSIAVFCNIMPPVCNC